MAATDFTVAIELGSTEITGIAGKKNADGSINLLAYASERSSDCIKKGAIYNLDKTAQSLKSVIKQLEDKLQASIEKVYVGVGGQSMRSIHNTITKHLDEDTKISQHLIDSILQANKEVSLLGQELLYVKPQEYKVGNNLLPEPVGIPTDNIEGHFLNIIARDTLKANIIQCFKQTGYEVADFLMAPLVTADVVLTNNEKRSGCALIDFGADTTTVSVYKNNILRHIAVIPLGSSNITKDIASLQIDEEDAEQLKIRYASAYTETSEDVVENNKEYKIDNKCTISANKLGEIVEARINEIIANVSNQIVLSNYGDKMFAGIVVTGGASNLPNLDKALANATKIDKIRIAKSSEASLDGNIVLPADGTCNTLIGLLSAGKENCCRINPVKETQVVSENEVPAKKETVEAEKTADAEKIKEAEAEAAAKAAEEANKALLKVQAEKRKLEECQNLVRDASQLIFERKYPEGLELLKKARLLDVASKQTEIDALEKEATRLYAEAIRVEELKAVEEEKEKKRAEERTQKCNDLIEKALHSRDKKHYKDALSFLEEASKLNIAGKKEEIETLKAEIGTKNKSWIISFIEKMTNASEKLMKDDEE